MSASAEIEPKVYALKHLPFHLHRAKQFDRLDLLLSSRSYFEACRREPELAGAYRSAVDLGWESCTSRGRSYSGLQYRLLISAVTFEAAIGRLPEELWPELVQTRIWDPATAVREALRLQGPRRLVALALLLPIVPVAEGRVTVTTAIAEALRATADESAAIMWCGPILATSPAKIVAEGFANAVREARDHETARDLRAEHLVYQTVRSLIPGLHERLGRARRDEVARLASDIARRSADVGDGVQALCLIADLQVSPSAKHDLVGQAIALAQTAVSVRERLGAVEHIAGVIDSAPDLLPELLRCAMAVRLDRFRSEAVRSVLPHVPANSPLFQDVVRAALRYGDPWSKLNLLSALIPTAPLEDRERLVQHLVEAIGDHPAEYGRVWMPKVVESLDGSHRPRVLAALEEAGVSAADIACWAYVPELLPAALNELRVFKGVADLDKFDQIIERYHGEYTFWERLLVAQEYLTNPENIGERLLRQVMTDLRLAEIDRKAKRGVRKRKDASFEVVTDLWYKRLELLNTSIPRAPDWARAKLVAAADEVFRFIHARPELFEWRYAWKYPKLAGFIPDANPELLPLIESELVRRGQGGSSVVALAKRYADQGDDGGLRRLVDHVVSLKRREDVVDTGRNLLSHLPVPVRRRLLIGLSRRMVRLGDGLGAVRMACALATTATGQRRNLHRFLRIAESLPTPVQRFEALVTLVPLLPKKERQQRAIELLDEFAAQPERDPNSRELSPRFTEDEICVRLIPLVPQAPTDRYLRKMTPRGLAELGMLVGDEVLEQVLSAMLGDRKRRSKDYVQRLEDKRQGGGMYSPAPGGPIEVREEPKNSPMLSHTLELFYDDRGQGAAHGQVACFFAGILADAKKTTLLTNVAARWRGTPSLSIAAALRCFLPKPSLQLEVMLEAIPQLSGEQRAAAMRRVRVLSVREPPFHRMVVLQRIASLEGRVLPDREIRSHLERVFEEASKSRTFVAVHDHYVPSTFRAPACLDRVGGVGIDAALASVSGRLREAPQLWAFAVSRAKRLGVAVRNPLLGVLARAAPTGADLQKLFEYALLELRITGGIPAPDDIHALTQIVSANNCVSQREAWAARVLLLLRQPEVRSMDQQEPGEMAGQDVDVDASIVPIDIVPWLPRKLGERLADGIVRTFIREGALDLPDLVERLIRAWSPTPWLAPQLFHAVSRLAENEFEAPFNETFLSTETNDALREYADALIEAGPEATDAIWNEHWRDFLRWPRWMLLDTGSWLFAPLLAAHGGPGAVDEAIDAVFDTAQWAN